MSTDRYDIVIIGTGAGGGTILRELAGTGLRILVIERGEFLPRERENWDEREVFEKRRYLAKDTWFDQDGVAFEPYTHYCVGGNTKVYGAALLRMRERDFGKVSHVGGISPAWPVSYEEFEPYYLKAEKLYSVHGVRGADPCEPWASGPYPYGPLEPEPRIKQAFDELTGMGYRPFPIPIGVRDRGEKSGDGACRLSAFDGYPDLTETKSDAHVVCVRPALREPNVTILTGAKAERIDTDETGREATSVVVTRGNERITVHADMVIVACGAVNSAALLLRSASDRHPRGLANSSGLVGRCFMKHQNGCLVAVLDGENDSKFQKHFGMTDFYESDGSGGPPLGTIQLMGKPDRGTLEWLRGNEFAGESIDEISKRTMDFFLTAEDLPDPSNRVTLGEGGSIRVAYTVNNVQAYEGLVSRFTGILREMETRHGRRAPVILHQRLGASGVSHQCGTARFGVDPSTSVLDTVCCAHDVGNLYVVDSSFFPSSSAVNPSLTIMANAMRVADVIKQRLGVSLADAAGRVQ